MYIPVSFKIKEAVVSRILLIFAGIFILSTLSQHGHNTTHDTDKCKVLKSIIAEAKGKDSSKSKNKSWSRKASEAKDKSKKELNSIVRKMVKEELACFSKDDQKKRSSDDSSVGSMDSNKSNESKHSNHEANVVEELDFSKLDFDNMDDIKDDVSV